MKRNLSTLDRAARMSVTAALVVTSVLTQAWPIAVLAALVAITGAIGWSPLYSVYGLSTVGGLHRECDDDYCGLPGYPQRDKTVSAEPEHRRNV